MSQKDIKSLITDNLDVWTMVIKSKNRTGRGSNKTYELYGIKKLRELILDLAVRGLLVPQDPNDEPASDLLKTIVAEKEQLIKEGKIKKTKPLPPLEKEEIPYNVPSSWEWVRLGEIGNIFNGNSVNARVKAEKYTNIEGVPYIATKDVGYGFESLNYNNGVSIPIGEPKFKVATKNSVLICSEGGSAGKKCGITTHDICFGNKLYANTAYGDIETKYILATYLSPSFNNNFRSSMTGIIGGISTAKFKNLPIAIPSVKEQKRIVTKVDKLMELCDQLEQQTDASIKAHKLLVENLLNALTQAKDHKTFQQAWHRIAEHFDTIFTTEHSIDQLKQTILQLAVMGKLVPQDPNDEPARELLKKIAAEKEKLIKEGKIKKQKPLPPIAEEEKPFELPEGWEWTKLGTISEINPRNDLDDELEVGFVPMPKVSTSYKGDHDQDLRLWGEIKKGYTHFKNGDIALAKITPCFENSKAAVFKNLHNGYGAGTTELHIARPINKTIDPLYVLLYLKSPNYLKLGKTKMTGSAGQKRVPKDYFSKNPFPLPPLNEQKLIVAKVDALMNLCDQMKFQIMSSKTIQTKIADSITEL